MNAEQASKRQMGADPPDNGEGRCAGGERRANKLHRTCRGNGDGMYEEEINETREAPAVIAYRQPATREGQAGPSGVAEGFVVARKPGNSGGAKGPQLRRTPEVARD